MTIKRRDNHSTEFGLWTRGQPEIDSAKTVNGGNGFTATDIDFEEKRKQSQPTYSQNEVFKLLDKALAPNSNYLGFWCIVFTNTTPDDGAYYIYRITDEKQPPVKYNFPKSRLAMLAFLKMEWNNEEEWAETAQNFGYGPTKATQRRQVGLGSKIAEGDRHW